MSEKIPDFSDERSLSWLAIAALTGALVLGFACGCLAGIALSVLIWF